MCAMCMHARSHHRCMQAGGHIGPGQWRREACGAGWLVRRTHLQLEHEQNNIPLMREQRQAPMHATPLSGQEPFMRPPPFVRCPHNQTVAYAACIHQWKASGKGGNFFLMHHPCAANALRRSEQVRPGSPENLSCRKAKPVLHQIESLRAWCVTGRRSAVCGQVGGGREMGGPAAST